MQRHQPVKDHDCLANQPLKVQALYLSAIGLFESSDYQLVSIVVCAMLGYGYIEGARIYQKNDQYHILYYPGKDNNIPLSSAIRVHPLGTIIEEVQRHLNIGHQITDNDDKLKNAKKHFLICENNTYYGFTVYHYIYANLLGDMLTTEDSIDRHYDLSYVTGLFSTARHTHKARGWQHFRDTWQCGHYVLEALNREINDQPLPEKKDSVESYGNYIARLTGLWTVASSFPIDDNILSKHATWYAHGSKVFAAAANIALPREHNNNNLFSYDEDTFDILLNQQHFVCKKI